MNDYQICVKSLDGFASVMVTISASELGYHWFYDFGSESSVCDVGFCRSLTDVFENVARSLCEVGFDTTTDLVSEAHQVCMSV